MNTNWQDFSNSQYYQNVWMACKYYGENFLEVAVQYLCKQFHLSFNVAIAVAMTSNPIEQAPNAFYHFNKRWVFDDLEADDLVNRLSPQEKEFVLSHVLPRGARDPATEENKYPEWIIPKPKIDPYEFRSMLLNSRI